MNIQFIYCFSLESMKHNLGWCTFISLCFVFFCFFQLILKVHLLFCCQHRAHFYFCKVVLFRLTSLGTIFIFPVFFKTLKLINARSFSSFFSLFFFVLLLYLSICQCCKNWSFCHNFFVDVMESCEICRSESSSFFYLHAVFFC